MLQCLKFGHIEISKGSSCWCLKPKFLDIWDCVNLAVSLLARYVPSSSPILIFKKKKQAQAKGHFYLKPGEEGRNSSTEGWAVWWGVLLPVSASVPEDCEPVPFLHLETEPISSHLGEETLCCPGVNLKEGVLGSPEDTHMFGCPF